MSTTPNHADRAHHPFGPSSIQYLATCAGFQGREETSEAAEMGTRIHEALEQRNPTALHSEEEVALYEKCVQLEDDFVSTWLGANSPDEDHHEIRLNVDLQETGTFGTCDRLTVQGTRALLGDYKSGVSQITHPEKNWQAKAYTIGVFQRWEVDEVTFAFYIPQYEDGTPHHTFTRADLPRLIWEVGVVILQAEKIRAKWGDKSTPAIEDLNPTYCCAYCRYETKCPALGAMALSTIGEEDTDFLTDSSPESLERRYQVAKLVESWAARTKEEVKAAVQGGTELPTLRLKSMGAITTCTDSKTLIFAAKEAGVSEAEVMALASIPLGKVADLVASKAPKDKARRRNDFLDHLDGYGILEKGAERWTLK